MDQTTQNSETTNPTPNGHVLSVIENEAILIYNAWLQCDKLSQTPNGFAKGNPFYYFLKVGISWKSVVNK